MLSVAARLLLAVYDVVCLKNVICQVQTRHSPTEKGRQIIVSSTTSKDIISDSVFPKGWYHDVLTPFIMLLLTH